jgi:hypothetical protein
MREWHQLTPAERATAWAELVDWAVWLHDRYELATEERLPRCWPQHPGLIEELWALRAWRLAIYLGDGSPAAGQAARYWHGELRQVLAAATAVYAAGCRAGHRSVMTVDVVAPGAREAWLAGDPLLGVPLDILTRRGWDGAITGDGDVVSDDVIRGALAAGDARPLGHTVTDLVHRAGSWWARDPKAPVWRRVTDPLGSAELDQAAARLAEADAAVQTRNPFRSSSH